MWQMYKIHDSILIINKKKKQEEKGCGRPTGNNG